VEKIFSITDSRSGITFNAEVKIEANSEKSTVKFYDTRYPHTPLGQFTGGSYYLSTILEVKGGLNIHGGVPDWSISAEPFQRFLVALRETL